MKQIILVIFGPIILLSCVKGKKVKIVEISAKSQEANEVKKICKELEAYGDIRGHMELIKYNHKRILYYLDQKDPFTFEEKIKVLADDIREAANKVQALISPEWTKEVYEMIYHWKVNRHDFKPSLGALFKKGFKIKDSVTMKAYFNGEERKDFLGNVKSKWDNHIATITFAKKSSYLDLCLLNETLILFHKFRIKGKGKIKSKYFNMYLTKEDLLKF